MTLQTVLQFNHTSRERLRRETSVPLPCILTELLRSGLFLSIMIQRKKAIYLLMELGAKYPHYLGKEDEDGSAEADL